MTTPKQAIAQLETINALRELVWRCAPGDRNKTLAHNTLLRDLILFGSSYKTIYTDWTVERQPRLKALGALNG